MLGYLEKRIQTRMAQGRSTKVVSMIKWIRTSRLSRKNSLSLSGAPRAWGGGGDANPGRGQWQTQNNHFTEVCRGFDVGSFLRLMDSCFTQLQAQKPSRTCDESKEEEEEKQWHTQW